MEAIQKVKVRINDSTYEYPVGTSLLDISIDFQKDYEHEIILAFVNDKLRELFKTVDKDCSISFVTTADNAGHKTYTRGMIIMLLKAFYAEFGKEDVEKVSVEYSLGNSLYFDYVGKLALTKERLDAVKRGC